MEKDNERKITVHGNIQTSLDAGINGGATSIEAGAGETRIESGNAARINPSGNEAFPNIKKSAGYVSEKLKKIIFAEKYKILEPLKVFSAEADLFIASDNENKKYILKYYRFNIEPKLEIIKTLQSIPAGAVIKIIAYGKSEEGRFYEIQEHAEHGSLADFIKNHENLTPEFIKEFIKELNECLYSIHSQNIIHRDIKPANILIRTLKPLDLVLTDFGISSISDATLHQTNLSRTITYSAPESITGLVSKATDYWAFGLILLEMAIGRHPYDGMDDRAVMFSIATKNVPYAETINNDFIDIIQGLLTRDDKKRWQHDEVCQFIAGQKPKVYFEKISDDVLNMRSKRKPYYFNEMEYYDFKPMAFQLACRWDEALEELISGRIKKWACSELNDEPNTLAMIDCLLNDRQLDGDEKLFEFIYRCNPELEMIYKNTVIDHNYVKTLAVKIFKNQADNQEKKIFEEIFKRNLIFKYHFITDTENYYEKEYKSVCDSCAYFSTPEAYARVILLSYFAEYKKAITQKIINLYNNNIILRAPEGYQSIKQAEDDIEKLAQGKDIACHRLIYLAEIPGEYYISTEEFRGHYADVLQKFKNNYKKSAFTDTLKNSIVKNKLSGIDWNFFLDFIDGKLYPSLESYRKIKTLDAAMEKILEAAERKGEKYGAGQLEAPSSFTPFARASEKYMTIEKPQWIKLITEDAPFAIICGIIFALAAIPTLNLWIIIMAYLIGFSIGNRFAFNLMIERSYFKKTPNGILDETIKRANEITIMAYIFGGAAGIILFLIAGNDNYFAIPFAAAILTYPAGYFAARFFIDYICDNVKGAKNESKFNIEPYTDIFYKTFKYMTWINGAAAILTIILFTIYSWDNSYVLTSFWTYAFVWGGLGIFLSLALNSYAGAFISKYLYANTNGEI